MILEYSDAGYSLVAKELANIAKHFAAGRMVYVLEGGYNPNNIANAVSKILDVLINAQ